MAVLHSPFALCGRVLFCPPPLFRLSGRDSTFRIPHLSAPCVYIPPRFVLCSGQKGGSPMDQIKIGRFIAETRRAKGLTQRQLADQLSISDKTISKWETGVSLR